MPHLTIRTNVAQSEIPDGFEKATAQLLAEVAEKPLEYVQIHLEAGCNLTQAATNGPCVFAELLSIGKMDETYRARYKEKILTHLAGNLNIDKIRCFLVCRDVQRDFWLINA